MNKAGSRSSGPATPRPAPRRRASIAGGSITSVRDTPTFKFLREGKGEAPAMLGQPAASSSIGGRWSLRVNGRHADTS
jgi:hypothetical protein